MLTCGEHITMALRRGLNVGSEDVSYDTELRAQAHYYLMLLRQEVWSISPLWWRTGDGTVAITANNSSGPCPADFNNFGVDGQVWLPDVRRRLSWIAPPQMDYERQANAVARGDPTHYTLKGQSAVGRPQLDVWPTPGRNITLNLLNYSKTLPPLIDSPTAPGVAVGAAGALTGSYRYRVTNVTVDGETDGGSESATVDTSSQVVDISQIVVSPSRLVTDRYVYRTVANNFDSYWFLQAMGDNITTSLLADNVDDVSLGTIMPTPAEAVTGMEVFPDGFHELVFTDGLVRMMRAGVKGAPFEVFSEGWRANVKRMWADQISDRHVPHVMPSFGGSRGSGRRPRILT